MSDVFGDAVLSYLNGNKKAEIEVWIDGLPDDPIPVKTFFRTFKEMPKAEQLALQNCKGKILDIGAAAGCHALWLQEQGFDVTALDISKGACMTLEQRGIRNVINASIFDIDPDQKFDTLLLLMNGMGMGGDLEGTTKLLNFLKSIMAPGAQIITDSSDIIYLYEEEDGSSTIPMHKYYGEIEFKIAFESNEKSSEESFPWVYVDPEMLEMICYNEKFQMEVIYYGDHFDYLARLTEKA